MEVVETKSEESWVSDTTHRTLLVEPTIEGVASGLDQWLYLRDCFSVGIEPTSQHVRACYSWERAVAEYKRILSEGLASD